ncbi:DUF4333 domain-containing protein [Nocardioides sambongensis]|uniref:DUF4333 domain-containing protein n=1 Tax=Nocardioides sambongensis TaxID=2589074 RepID=UPI0015E85100|nr:DUF4333 domain-containing protein [Nocardioides sambongensis]
MPRRRLLAASFLASVLAASLSACGAGSVSTDDLEKQVASLLEEQTGNTPDTVDCPDELPAEEGETVRCSYEMLGYEVGVSVTAESVDGGEVNFSIQVDDEPTSGPDDTDTGDTDTGDTDTGDTDTGDTDTGDTDTGDTDTGDTDAQGGTTIPGDHVAAEVTRSLTESVGEEPDAVECPSPLTARTGSTTRCTLSADGTDYGVTVEVTEFDEATGNYHLDIQVDDQPLP